MVGGYAKINLVESLIYGFYLLSNGYGEEGKDINSMFLFSMFANMNTILIYSLFKEIHIEYFNKRIISDGDVLTYLIIFLGFVYGFYAYYKLSILTKNKKQKTKNKYSEIEKTNEK